MPWGLLLNRWTLYAVLAIGAWFAWSHYKGTLIEQGRAEASAEWSEKYQAREAAWKAAAAREEARYAAGRAAVEEDARRRLATLQAQLDAAREIARKARQDLDLARSRYVTAQADAGCVVPVGFVLYHNRAAAIAAGQPDASGAPEPTAAVADAPSGTPLSAVAQVAADNLAALGECREQVKGWQAHWTSTETWYASVAQSFNPTGVTP